MLKEIFTLLLMAVLISVSAWNIKAVDRLCANIEARLDESEKLALSGNIVRAEDEFNKALNIWLQSEGYTHIFIRHPEIDSCSDAFYDALEVLVSKEEPDIHPSFEKLRYHLESIASMERVSLGNIF